MLRTALTAATREELVTRNVASLVEAPKVVSRETTPWTLDETLTFLEKARRDPLYAASVLAIAMGLRRGEVLGLRWSDVDLDGRVIRISNQVQRIGGELYQDTAKTGKIRPVPLPLICLAALRWHRLRQTHEAEKRGTALSSAGLVFTTRSGRPVEPRNLNRSFSRLTASAGLRPIRLHDARHGCATLLTAAGVAPRVLMEILGHSQISMAMDVYTHVAQDTQREAISHMDRLLKRRIARE
ncbi:tyrosine-type recombinase/integrase [Streptomyces nigrescens]|uniref:tyrosine-type recombinase/integrase n=1 Tax=Streptomyces nigrescens TaxID=1920 RepID=UPI0021C3F96E|nr:site-specific integrase [Streptomyces nigrescens]